MSDSTDETPSNDPHAGTDRADAAPAGRDLILDLDFTPDWARKPADEASMVVREPQRDRRGRGGGQHQNRRDSGSRPPRRDGDGRRPGGGKPSGQRPAGQQRQGQRPAGQQGQGRPSPGNSSGSGHPGAPRGGHGRPQRPHRPAGPPRPPITIRFVPDDQQLAVVLKKMRAGQRAYPLQNITALFLRHPDSCRALLQIESKNPDEKLTQCTVCGSVAYDAMAMHTHLLNKHIGDMFTEETIEAEPPKGNFVCIRKCGLSNELLGPPNHNSTEARIRELHATRFANMPIDRYRERIKTLHDEALIEAWKDQWRKQKVYRLTSDIEDATRAAQASSVAADAPAEDSDPANDTPPLETESDATVETPSPDEIPDDVAAQDNTEVTEETGTAVEGNAAEEEAAEEAAQQEAAPEESAPEPIDVDLSSIKTYTWNEASDLFMSRCADKMTRKTFRATLPGGLAGQLEDPWLRDSTADAWRRECRSPRSLAFAIRGAFKHRKMHVFKVGKQQECVTAIPPVPLAPDRAVASIGEVLRYLQEHPGSTRQTLVEGLRPGASDNKSMADEILGPLGWMVERGHIIEFFDGKLSVPKAAAGRKQPAPKKATDEVTKDDAAPSPVASTPESTEDAAPAPAPPPVEAAAEAPAETAPAEDASPPEGDAVAADTPPKTQD